MSTSRLARIMFAVFIAALGAICSAALGFSPGGAVDVYALCADGNAMWNNGFHILRMMPHAVVDAPIVCQEWALSAVLSPLSVAFGWNGVGIWSSLQAMLLYIALVFLISCSTEISRMQLPARIVISCCAALGGLLLSSPMLSPRPIWLSAAIICSEASLVRAYMRRPRFPYIAGILILVVLESNFHASFVWLDFAVMLVFAAISGRPFRKAWPLLLCPLAACVNPYGIDALLYLPVSSAALQGIYIDELLPLWDPNAGLPRAGKYACFISSTIIIAGAAMFTLMGGWKVRERSAFAIAAVVGVFSAFIITRNAWIPCLLAIPCSTVMLLDEKRMGVVSDLLDKMPVNTAVAACLVAMFTFNLAQALQSAYNIGVFPTNTSRVDDISFRNGGSIFVDQFSGGMAEIYGMDVAMDTRPEVWGRAFLPGSKTSLLDDYREMVDRNHANSNTLRAYIEKYRFEWIPTRKDSLMERVLVMYGKELGYSDVIDDDDCILWHYGEIPQELIGYSR